MLTLTVVEGDGPSLLRRNWLQCIWLDWSHVHSVSTAPLESMLDRKKAVFQPGLATSSQEVQGQNPCRFNENTQVLQGTPSSLHHVQNVKEEELECLTEKGIVEHTQFSEWAAPVVPVLKSDRESIHLCGDYKSTINQIAKTDQYTPHLLTRGSLLHTRW